jgi:hypothetical protein
MFPCANCDNPASYAYRLSSQKKTLYCANHLPKFLRTEKYAARLERTEFFAEKQQSALNKLSFSSTPPAAMPTKRKRKTTKKVTEVKATEDEAVGTLEVEDKPLAEKSAK